ncbi:MAG: tyrosine-type recombinase/integrase [Anaerolineae bacterium]|nr:tyrosine-type recombinase/integrase [Anaerolineae bacterium]
MQTAITEAEGHRAEQFWGWLKERGRRSRTISAYQTDWREFAAWYQQTSDEPFDLTRLTALDLNDYRSWGLTQQLAPSTINRRLGFFKHYASWGLEEGFVDATVFRAIKDVSLVRQQKLAPKALSQAEVRRLLKEVELRADARDQAIIYTLLYTGLRVGELAHLQMEDVQLSERKGTIVVWGAHAKGGKQREVPVPHEARQRLAAYLDQHPNGKGNLFLGQRGPLGEDAIGRIVGKYATWAELEGVTPHVLRHTFSYNYLEKTSNDLVGLANILGHDNVTTTQIYTQKPLGALQDEIEKVQFF